MLNGPFRPGIFDQASVQRYAATHFPGTMAQNLTGSVIGVFNCGHLSGNISSILVSVMPAGA
jgi:membrane associated rhomboid family serine protease